MRRIWGWLGFAGLFILSVAAVWAQAPAPPAPAARPLTLEEAICTALAHNPTVRIAEQQVRRAGGQLTEARSGLLPRVSAAAVYTRTGPIPTISIPTSTGTETIQVGVPEDTRTRLSLALPLDISGQITAAVGAASFNRLAQEFALAATRQNVALQVQESFLAVLRAQGLAAVAEEAVAAAREHLRVAQVNFAAGTVAHFDVLRAETQLADFQQQLVVARNAVQLAKSSLNFAMGENVNQPLELLPPAPQAPVVLPPVEESQQQAGLRRPELLQAHAARRAAEKGVHIARSGLLPTLALQANQNFDENPSSFGGQKENWEVSAALTLPIFDGAQTKGRLRQARADAESALQGEQLTRNQVMLEVRQAHLNVQEAQERIRVAEVEVTQAREALRLAQLRYQAGLSAAIEVTDTEVALAQSRNNQVNAFYDYLLAIARLQKAVGAPTEELTPAGCKS